MTRKPKLIILTGAAVILSTALLLILNSEKLALFNTQGMIADQQRNLMYFTMLLSLVVIIPVFIMTFFIAWNYRDSNTKAKYKPDWDHSLLAESIWWGIPILLISILAIVTWSTSHSLDPFKPVSADGKQITIQVVALDWKWLFIYPDQKIASVNFNQIPTNTPIKYEITSDAPMNSFWIPQLGGQIYAMSGMVTNLNLVASNPGDYRGVSANISGEGFAGMHFNTRASSSKDFDKWVTKVKKNSNKLNLDNYSKLARPSENSPVTYYGSISPSLYDTIVMKYMHPSTEKPRAE